MSYERKIINDPVFGFINIPKGLLYDLVRHPLLQRLTRIRQLGLSSVVYPGAQHTRFQHSLGAFYLMTEAIQHLTAKGNFIFDSEAEAVEAAILMHDIGHGPFSHVLEDTIVRGVSHEDISLLLMERINREMNGQLTLAIRIFKDEYPKRFLHQLVSGQLDMDRLDYLRRDSFYTGVTEGNIGSARIIKMLDVKDDHLVVEAKGIYSIENFLTARRLMYWQVYLHKTSVACERLLVNTLLLNVYNLLWSFPVPLILAILLNQIRSDRKKRFIQTSIYVPYFISTVVLAGMLYIFLSPTSGIVNLIRTSLGMTAIDYMSDAGAFRTLYILSGIWQSAGYGTILYIATLSGVDPSLYEAAEIDGASIWQKIRYIDLPSLVPTAVMVFILDCGKLLSSNTDKALVMQTPGNIPTSDIIGVYVYNVGLGSGQFSYTAAIGLFVNIINFILIITVNKIAKKTTDTGLF